MADTEAENMKAQGADQAAANTYKAPKTMRAPKVRKGGYRVPKPRKV